MANLDMTAEENGHEKESPPIGSQAQEDGGPSGNLRSTQRPLRPTVHDVRPKPRALIEWHDPNKTETSEDEEYTSESEGVRVKSRSASPQIPQYQRRRRMPKKPSLPISDDSLREYRYPERFIPHRVQCYPTWSSPAHHPDPPKLTFFWASQIDIELGSWATPWKNGLFWDCTQALDMMIEICMTGIALCNRKAVLKRSNELVLNVRADTSEVELRSAGIHFVSLTGDPTLQELWSYLRDGKHTWPPFAMNGHDGMLEPAPHQFIKFPAFPEENTLPPLLLLRSVHNDLNGLNPHTTSQTRAVDRHLHLARDRLLELSAIDHWLAHAGSTAAVVSSRVNLLISTPGIVEEVWTKFHGGIMDVQREDKWSREGGGFEEMQRLATKIDDWLGFELTTPAERFYVWVALLRAVKVLTCVGEGPATGNVSDLFDDDVLVYLV